MHSKTGPRMLSVLVVLLLTFNLQPSTGLAQQPQTNDVSNSQPLFSGNARYVQGVGPGYWPTAGAGLTLNLSAGTAHCGNPPGVVNYAGGYLAMTANATNYVYLDPAAACVPAFVAYLASAPSAPILSQVAGGTQDARTYCVKTTYVNAHGETTASTVSSLAVSANYLLRVTSPAAVAGATGWNVYISWENEYWYQQNDATPLSLGSNWTEPTTGLPYGGPWALPSSNTTGFLPGEVPVAKVVTSSNSITSIIDLRSWFDRTDAQGSVVRADLMSGADAAAKINAAISALPNTGGVVDARGLAGMQVFGSDMFAQSASLTKPGTLLLGPGFYILNATQNVPPNWLITGSPGGYDADTGNYSVSNLGTYFLLKNASVGFKFNDVFRTKFENVNVDCGSQAGSVGIWYTSDNNPATSQNEFSQVGVYNCQYSFQIGLPVTQTGNYNQMDQLTVRRFQIISWVPGAEAFTFNSGNAAQAATFEEGSIQGVNIGFNLKWYGGLAQFRRIAFGSLTNGAAWNISGVSNASPIVITTSFAHGYVTGNRVQISNVGGNTAANGTWYITVTDATHFSLNNSTGNGNYTSGGAATRLATDYSLSCAADYWIEDSQAESGARGSFQSVTGATNATPIVITAPAHGYQTGDIVNVVGVSGNTGANAMWQITVIDADTFSLNGSAGNGAPSLGACSSDGPFAYNSGSCVQRIDTNFVNVNGGPYAGASVTLVGNKFDEPVVVARFARVTSISNFGGAPAICTANSNCRVVSINDRLTNPGPLSGWDTSAGGQVLRLGGGDTGSDSVSIVLPGGGKIAGASGNVGIGTSTPQVALDVASDRLRVQTAHTPATSSESCYQGSWTWDGSYIYICTNSNVWRRVALSSF